ncbi:MAG: rod shape-determining protein MreC [Actinomycetota bacterium]|nr:rod shape-determining protein MreC [Actinomycetota bacterium]
MLNRDTSSRLLPTFITLLVLGVLLMTIDVRLEGKGVVGVLRSGTQSIVAPLQEVTSLVVNPVADMFDSLTNVASLREQNIALRAELAEAEAELVGVQDRLALLALLEQLYGLDTADPSLGQTVANVIGKVESAFVVDKGSSDGVVVGQPVIDTNGYVVGTVRTVTSGSATILPITTGRNGVTVLVNDQVGTLTPQINTSEMRLLIGVAREPVLEGDRVVTSAGSLAYPAGLPVGIILHDAAPESNSLTASVEPYVNTDTLRIVVILAWPPDPVTAATDDGVDVEATTTTTTLDTSSTSSTPETEG